MKADSITPGKTNKITYCVQEGNHALLHKHFEKKLVCYNVCWPISRMKIEIATLQKLSEILADNSMIAVPKLYPQYQTTHSFAMNYIQGKTITQILDDPMSSMEMLPSIQHLVALIHTLQTIQNISLTDFSDDIQKYFISQREIVACMYQNKLKNRVPVLTSAPWYFCLGDVTLNNILYDGNKLYLIDFECAHFGYYGYDIGQLLGMSKARSARSPLHLAFYQQLCRAFQQTTPSIYDRHKITEWEDIFCNYYRL